MSSPVLKCRRKFLRYFRRGFEDETYLEWERNYKWQAHERWQESLGRDRLRALLNGGDTDQTRFERWVACVGGLPRRQTRVLTWPLVTVIGFIAQPDRHLFLKPMVTRAAAKAYGYQFDYVSRPNWGTYTSLLAFADQIRRDQQDLRPRDMIDLQGFIWVQGSDEY